MFGPEMIMAIASGAAEAAQDLADVTPPPLTDARLLAANLLSPCDGAC